MIYDVRRCNEPLSVCFLYTDRRLPDGALHKAGGRNFIQRFYFMKKQFLLFCAAGIAFCPLGLYAKNAKQNAPYVMEEFTPDKVNRKLGYQIVDGGNTVVFVFDADAYHIKSPKRVFVEGSFNGWAKGTGSGWALEPYKGNIWTLAVAADDVKVPGNSGFPEFKFYVTADVEYIETVCGKELHRTRQENLEPAAVSRIPGFQMATNNLILFPGDNPETVVQNVKTAATVKKLKDFDLSNADDRATLSNVRVVPGTTKLLRGYHPYKLSRAHLNTEKTRLELVNKAIEENGVQSIITLSGNEQVISGKETISGYIQNINYAGNHLFIDTSYNTVYYQSAGKEFGTLMADIITFINGHPGPYYIHCRLGTDRTGVTSAVLAALCGASWEEIVADYQKTNEMGIKEFRDYRLLQYSFEKMLGKPIGEVENLQKEVGDYFVGQNFVTQSDLNTLVSRLK